MLRQQYDIIGKKDSIVTDSTVTQLFYPQVRAEHTISYNTYTYRFFDSRPDTAFYDRTYGYVFPGPYIIVPTFPSDTFYRQDKWKILSNDFSFVSIFLIPKTRNNLLKVGATLENFSGEFDSTNRTFFNAFIHGEYRNHTRNQKWDIEAYGKFYLSGYNAADYNGSISLRRYLSKKFGFLQVGFQNADRTPSFVFTRSSSYSTGTQTFNKENITNLFASVEQPKYNLKLSANYYLISNYAYFEANSKQNQESSLFNVLQINAEKIFHLNRKLGFGAQRLNCNKKPGRRLLMCHCF